MPELSILIPSRNEEFLTHTVNDILLHMEGDTEILVALDGQWANPPLPVHPRLTVVYHPVAKGQRQSTNALARLSKAKYIMKVDAHCAFDQGFDVKLMARCEPDWTVTPRGYNLLVFHRVCKACGHKNDMGPSVQPCKKCKQIAGFTREMVWKPRLSRKWDSMRFDHDLKFAYWGAYTLRPEWEQQGDYKDTMSLLGACWFLRRDRYWALDGMDEQHGSWGQMGTELACKTWLSGGRLVCNTTTWFAHLFRTQGADFGFPYPLSGREIDRAREWSRDLWMHNRWPKQIHPLSWLIERFAPLPGWHDDVGKATLDKVNDEGAKFVLGRRIILPPQSLPASEVNTNLATPQAVLVGSGKLMTPETQRLPGVIPPLSAQDILLGGHNGQMVGITAGGVATHEMVNNSIGRQRANEPGIHQPMHQDRSVGKATKVDSPVAIGISESLPDPTSIVAKHDVLKKDGDQLRWQPVNREFPGVVHSHSSSLCTNDNTISKCALYYTDNRLDPKIMAFCQKRLLEALNGIPLVTVSLQPMDFGRNYVLPLERGQLTMFKQILAGLEVITEDVVFLVEHDLAYHPSHFLFTPPSRTVYYFNRNTWKVDAVTGKALHYLCDQVSGCCAYRELLLQHYRKRVERVEREGKYDRSIGYEPGSHQFPRGIDQYGRADWMSEWPNIDIRHGHNLSRTRWSQDQFRNKNTCLGWVESDRVIGWGKTQGRFLEFLKDVENGVIPSGM